MDGGALERSRFLREFGALWKHDVMEVFLRDARDLLDDGRKGNSQGNFDKAGMFDGAGE